MFKSIKNENNLNEIDKFVKTKTDEYNNMIKELRDSRKKN